MIKKMMIGCLGLIVSLYCVAMLGLYLLQEQLIFPGIPLEEDYSFDYELPFKEVYIPVEGGRLHALHFQQENPRGLVFFLHGNAGNLRTWATGIDFYQKANYDLLMMDYRGYGKSGGEIQSQAQLHQDIRDAWDFIRPQYQDQAMVIYGRSLGSALAVELARQVEHDLLVLVSPFTSMNAMAKQLYPYAPLWLLRYPLESDRHIQEMTSDILFIHGDKDQFISLDHSLDLQKRSRAPNKLLIIEGAGHGDIHQYPSYLEGLAKALP